ncbi:MAG: aconitase/3-isopropylmalate dehydratase large subunit family protein [bacterium]
MAGMTITEKILARASGRDQVTPGELVWADLYSILIIDMLGKSVFRLFDSLGVDRAFNPDRVICVSDHLSPPPSVEAATLLNEWRELVKAHEVPSRHFYDLGTQGIGHQIMVEQGHVLPGNVTVGTDSHANTYGAVGALGNAVSVTDAAVAMATGKCWFRVPKSVKFHVYGEWPPWVTGKDLSLHVMGMMHWNGHLIYKALEYDGPAIRSLDIAGRMTLANMSVDLGAKNGIVGPDQITKDYLEGRVSDDWRMLSSDSDAVYGRQYELDVGTLSPMVAAPHRLDNIKRVEEVAGTRVNKAYVGTCTNGRLGDIAAVATILKGRQVHPDVKLIVTPASQTVYLDAIKDGHIQDIVEAGGAVSMPGCASCFGSHTGVAGDGDVVISAGNRNMRGRMGSRDARVYLASPAVVAASALRGEIADPRVL